MDGATIAEIASLPVTALLIYLIVRQQTEIERLLGQICSIQAQHATDLLELSMRYADKILLAKDK